QKTAWRSVGSVHLGGEYLVTEAFAARLGFIYDDTPAPRSTLSPLLPDAPRYIVTAGAGYTVSDFTIDLAYLHAFFEDRKTLGTETFPASYETAVDIVSAQLSYHL